MSGKKSLKTIIESELRDLMSDGVRKAMNTKERIDVLNAAIKWAAVDAKISEAEEGSMFNSGDDNDERK